MKFTLKALALLILIVSCSRIGSKTERNEDHSTQHNISYAEHLNIYKDGDSYRVEIFNADKGEISFKAVFGNHKPQQVPSGYMFIQTPVKDLAVLSATQIGMLSKLQATSCVEAVSSGDFIEDKALKKRLANGKITDLGAYGESSVEQVISSGSKFILYSDFGEGFPQEAKLNKMGITCIPIPDWRELHPLGKAEWIKFIGILCGKGDEAEKHFSNIEKKYKELTQLARSAKNKPSVISGNMIGDQWTAPNGDSYHARLIDDAGGDYLYKERKGTGSLMISLEQVLSDTKHVDIWINPGFRDKKGILKNNAKLKHFSIFQKGRIWCYSGNMNHYWELSASEPEKVLEDLIRIFHPELLPKGKMYFYQKVLE